MDYRFYPPPPTFSVSVYLYVGRFHISIFAFKQEFQFTMSTKIAIFFDLQPKRRFSHLKMVLLVSRFPVLAALNNVDSIYKSLMGH